MGELNDYKEIVYFSFDIHFNKNSSETITIHVTPIKGVFKIFVSDKDSLPTAEQNYWNVDGD